MHFSKVASFIFLLFSGFITAQSTIAYRVNTEDVSHRISPYIYGMNGQDLASATAQRSGGNRLTGYNWENNFSNAGEDYFNHSDDYLPFIYDLPEELYDVPGSLTTSFIKDCKDADQYSLITLPMAGYVAADGDGTVEESQTAPSDRWIQVENESPEGIKEEFDLNDNYVFVDQFVQFLKNSESGSPRGYSLDNEPALWPYTHPRIHPEYTKISELIERSIDLAKTIKTNDEASEVFGPAVYGFYAMVNLQDAPDWEDYHETYPTFLDAYLDKMKKAENAEGQRLLDVLDVHWYPEPEGVYFNATDTASAIRRMHAPRSLWDPTYREESWIANYLEEPIQMINRWQKSIDTYYPETKLAITEYDYSGYNHISGGIAQVEALGAFAMKNIYFASKWNEAEAYIKSAFVLFLNVGDGFGDEYINSSSSDIEQSSIFSSIDEESKNVHLILTNRSFTDAISAKINISSETNYDKVEVYGFNQESTEIEKLETTSITDNFIPLGIEPLSALHIIAYPSLTSTELEEKHMSSIQIFPNPASEYIFIDSSSDVEKISVYNLLGVQLFEQSTSELPQKVDIRTYPEGVNFIHAMKSSGETQVIPFTKQ